MPNGNGAGRTVIIAIIAALLVPSVSAIIVVAQMYQRMTHLEDDFHQHGTRPAHGTVAERLAEHDTKFDAQRDRDMGQDRSLETVKRSNERLSIEQYQTRTQLELLKQRVDSFHRDEVHR